MNIIKQTRPFGELIFAERQSIQGIDYNSKVSFDDSDIEPIVVIKESKTLRALSKRENGLINKKTSIFKKKDNNHYVIFFIDGSKVSFNYGDRIDSKSKDFDELSGVVTFLRFSYEVRVTNGIKFVENILCNDNSQIFSRDFVQRKINAQIESTIKEQSSIALKEYGNFDYMHYKSEIKDKIEAILMNIGFDLGLEIRIINFEFELNKNTRTVQDDAEMNAYQYKKAKELK